MQTKILPFFLLFFILCSCNRNSLLKEALALSGPNRPELEQVLAHYSKDPRDSLKLRAAVFLIENMPGHYSYRSEELDAYRSEVLSDSLLNTIPLDLRNIFLGYPYRLGEVTSRAEKIEDIEIITADYLIDNIERAFEVWQRPWARFLTFDEFCEFVLPYRVEHERLEYWRDSLGGLFDDPIDRLSHADVYRGSVFQICQSCNDQTINVFQKVKAVPVRFESSVIRKAYDVTDWGCADFTYGIQFPMRAAGIPVTKDFTPQWAARRNSHFWNVLLTEYGKMVTFIGYDESPLIRHKPAVKMPKVFRNTYSRNPRSLAAQNLAEPVPALFQNPFILDVTEEYMRTCDIVVDLLHCPSQPRKAAYLCVFDNSEWVPVDWGYIKGNRVKFQRIGREIVYMAGYWIDEEFIPASHPFHVDTEGRVNYIMPDKTNLVSLHLTRKYPMFGVFVAASGNLAGTVFEGSDDPAFHRCEALDTIRRNTWGMFGMARPVTDHRYRYWRLRSGGAVPFKIAEFDVFADGRPEPLRGKVIGSPDETPAEVEKSLAADNDLLTSMTVREWVGMDMGRAVRIDSIRYISQNDDNHVVPGETYELLYCDGPFFRSMGRQKAGDYSVQYDSVPSGALYWLRDLSKGKQERIFTVQDGQVLYW